MRQFGVGFWPGLKEGEPDHWYIAWPNGDTYSSAPGEPTEAEVRKAVAILNEHWE
jgi:hypothetical protein